jgi:hypothetical protein
MVVLKGNGELDDRYVADLFTTLRDTYLYCTLLRLGGHGSSKTLEQLKTFDLIVCKTQKIFRY